MGISRSTTSMNENQWFKLYKLIKSVTYWNIVNVWRGNPETAVVDDEIPLKNIVRILKEKQVCFTGSFVQAFEKRTSKEVQKYWQTWTTEANYLINFARYCPFNQEDWKECLSNKQSSLLWIGNQTYLEWKFLQASSVVRIRFEP